MLPRVRTAIDVKKAIDEASRKLKEIGHHSSRAEDFHSKYDWQWTRPGTPEKVQKIDHEMAALARQLVEISSRYPIHKAGDSFWVNSKLRITQQGCEFDGPIDEKLKDLLRQWFEHADVSGFGNVKVMETQLNPDVRDAREIPADKFSVEPGLLRKVEEVWGKNFMPSAVRAEPYKIHLYGPGGQFRAHLDTPEKGLVGTFLLGLGDTTKRPRFSIDGKSYSAHHGSWVAFYPDVAHEVERIETGYRAVIAFKIFGVDEPGPGCAEESVDFYAKPRLLISDILKQLRVPFGIEFTHLYCKSMTEPSGFDALLLAAARELPNVSVYTLPVVTRERLGVHEEEPEANYYDCPVYPFTDTHLDFPLGDDETLERDKSLGWMAGLDVPFFSITADDYDYRSPKIWNKHYREGPGYTGNESRSHDENSIYLAHAMVVIPLDGIPPATSQPV